MIQKTTLPSTEIDNFIEGININVDTKQAIVRIIKTVPGEQTQPIKKMVDIKQLLIDKSYTVTQISGLKKFFKQIIASSLSIDEAEITGEIFPDDPVEETTE